MRHSLLQITVPEISVKTNNIENKNPDAHDIHQRMSWASGFFCQLHSL